MTTIAEMARDLVDEWRDSGTGDAAEYVTENAADQVPMMTTTLFAMVVNDNALAFLDAPIEGGEPFRVLHSAIAAEVERVALEMIESE